MGIITNHCKDPVINQPVTKKSLASCFVRILGGHLTSSDPSTDRWLLVADVKTIAAIDAFGAVVMLGALVLKEPFLGAQCQQLFLEHKTAALGKMEMLRAEERSCLGI